MTFSSRRMSDRRQRQMRQLDMRGKACPMPVIETKKILAESRKAERVTVLVDNEIAVQNLTKLAGHEGMDVESKKHSEHEFAVVFTPMAMDGDKMEEKIEEQQAKSEIAKGRVVVIASDKMGEPEQELGKILVKGFIYALSRQDVLPETMIFYNGGAGLTAEGSESLEDLRYMEEEGVQILTCGTCLKHLGLEDKLQVGAVSNMYEIAEKMAEAQLLIRP